MSRLIIAVLFGLTALTAQAACEFTLKVGDAIQFGVTQMKAEASCDNVTVTLNHTGKLPTMAMGHNWVLTRSADLQSVAADGIADGLESNYLNPGRRPGACSNENDRGR